MWMMWIADNIYEFYFFCHDQHQKYIQSVICAALNDSDGSKELSFPSDRSWDFSKTFSVKHVQLQTQLESPSDDFCNQVLSLISRCDQSTFNKTFRWKFSYRSTNKGS